MTKAPVDVGFESAGESPEGHQHRWTRGGATIDVLIAEHVGEKAAARRGVTGGTPWKPEDPTKQSTGLSWSPSTMMNARPRSGGRTFLG